MENSGEDTFTLQDDILICRIESTSNITLEKAKQLVAARKELINGKAYKTMIVFPKLSNMDKSARDYLASDEAKEGILAGAIVTKSTLGRVIINFFIFISNQKKRSFPEKVFNHEEDAIEWLSSIDV
ncbi:MAG: hypothetical protein HUJ25_11545 [Crocinitomicaceae bacterium]|nr:hypothetical protein [Crocinitomicaceae bacterium]